MASVPPIIAGAWQLAGERLTPVLPGLLLAITIAAAARQFAVATPLPPVFYALVLGMAFAPVVTDARFAPGIGIAARPLLRVGVALLGVQVTIGDFLDLGLETIAIVLASLFITLVGGAWFGERLGLRRPSALVSSGAVAICGASAALAIAAVMPRDERLDEDTAAAVAGITIIGTAGMLLFPMLALSLNLDPLTTGVFLGATLHEVVQAVGAGFAVSDEVGTAATVTKLLRVACLAPIVAAIALWSRVERPPASRPPLIPFFLVAFLVFAALSSARAIPQVLLPILIETSRWALLAAIAALGMKTSLPRMFARGPASAMALTASSLLITIAVLAALLLSRPS